MPVLARVRRECIEAVRAGRDPSYFLIASSIGNAALPFLQRYALQGAAYSRGYFRTRRKPLRPETKAVRSGQFSAAWDVLPPEVVAEARRLAMELAGHVADSVRQQVRDAVTAGVKKGQSVNQIADAVASDTMLDPRRAYTIAQTETSRAVHAGQAAQGRALGAVGLEWIASSDACDFCAVMNGQQVRTGQPFYVWQTGNPAYARVMHPPAHPHCFCSAVDVYAEEWRGK